MSFEQRVDTIVRTVRSRTGNLSYSSTSGVPQRDIVRAINDAQEHIYNKILQAHSSLFEKQTFLGTVNGQATVTLPDDIYLDHNIVTVHFAYNGNPINYAPLQLRTVRQEVSVQGYPSSYFLLGNSIYLSPIPSNTVSNALRVTYQYVIPDLDIRRGLVGGANAGDSFITLTADSGIIQESIDDLTGSWVDYFCVVDQDGNQLLSEKAIDSGAPYDATTRQIGINGAVLTAAEADAVNNASAAYLVFGKNATTHSALPRVCERFITEYAVLRTQMRDSNKESVDTNPLLQAIKEDILSAVEELEEDIYAIPISDYSMLNYADEI